VAKYKKKRARELRHDRFRDTAMTLFERFGDRLEGRGRKILYGLGGLVLAGILALFFVKWNNRKNDEARRAMGRAIAIATTPVSSSGLAIGETSSFKTEQERAQKAVEEFQKVAAKYGEPYHSEAQYLAATNLLSIDRPKAIAELTELSKGSNGEVTTLAKFALAQALEADGKYDDASQLYRDLVTSGGQVVTPDTANLRLALVYSKQGKKKEASDLLFNIVDASRKAKDSDQVPLPPSGAAGDAARELEKLDPERYTQLPPEAPPLG
jgi:tetratricopeptide (TPR) repeat protein